ncbi:sugar 3,4-ketoisomerase [Marinobacterium jannaschii]|uniref:sugar 3,4-ketoisomerase n=1 Tax=Marinobacterium jannaschii TaxID=64970 RepID=UPI00048229AC|nr:FdtA/QdtA family cupin domain-containing protein [Marinobacterium jannaschii]
MSLVKFIEFPALGDSRGSLVVIEGNETVSFDIKRVYYIYGTHAGVSRGFHAHKELKQVAVCIAGKCNMLLDNGAEKSKVLLDSPTKGVLIDDMIWHEMHDFSDDCVLLVLASEHYDESDYIREYDQFREAVKL